jgi:nucleoside-diphosphate-sugar epimerase
MKILITGAKGFIGSHLAQYLDLKGHELKLIDNFSHPSHNPIKVDYGDIRYYYDIASSVEWSDIVIHLASQIHVDKSINNPEETIETNVKGTLNILEACRKFNKRLIFASSSEVYGTSQTGLMDESHPLDSQSPYAASKVAGDRLCHAYFRTYDLPVVILRNFNTFGPFQNDGQDGASYGAVIGIFTRAALKNKPLKIYGDGRQERDYMYITDCIQGYGLCINNRDLEGHVLNIGSGETITINELANMIVKITNSKSEIIHVAPRAGEVRKLQADITKAKKFGLDIHPDFEKNLIKYIEWFKQNKDF